MLAKKRTGLTGRAEDGAPLHSIFAEAAALSRRLGLLSHAREARSHLGRGILHDLAQHGPQTVPQLARARNVSRQHIQTQVNRLATDGQLEFVDNPAHQRSSLVRISSAGKEWLAAIERREETHWAGLGMGLAREKLQLAAEVLKTLRTSIDYAPRSASPKSNSTKPGSPARRRKLTSRKQKMIRPMVKTKADQPPAPAEVPAATSTNSDPEEFPISML